MSNNDNLKEELKEIKNKLNYIENVILQKQSIGIQDSWKRYIYSYYTLYFSIFISAVIGVLGNWVIALWYLPTGIQANEGILGGLIGFLGVTFVLLFYFAIKGKREYDKLS